MAATAHVVHHVPGRVRLRIPHRRHHHEFFASVEQRLQQCPNVSAVSTNPGTASVLVHYQGELEAVLVEAARLGLHELLDFDEGLPPIEPVVEAVLDRLIQVDRHVVHRSGGALDGRGLILLILIGAGIAQLLRGQVLGPAVPLLWYAAHALGLPKPPEKLAGDVDG